MAYVEESFRECIGIRYLGLVVDDHNTGIVPHPGISALVVDDAGCVSAYHILLQDLDIGNPFTLTVGLHDLVGIRYI